MLLVGLAVLAVARAAYTSAGFVDVYMFSVRAAAAPARRGRDSTAERILRAMTGGSKTGKELG